MLVLKARSKVTGNPLRGPKGLHRNPPCLCLISHPVSSSLCGPGLLGPGQGLGTDPSLCADALPPTAPRAHSSPASMGPLLGQRLVREAATHHPVKHSSPLSLLLGSTLFFDIVTIYRVKTSDFTSLATVCLFSVDCNLKKCKLLSLP